MFCAFFNTFELCLMNIIMYLHLLYVFYMLILCVNGNIWCCTLVGKSIWFFIPYGCKCCIISMPYIRGVMKLQCSFTLCSGHRFADSNSSNSFELVTEVVCRNENVLVALLKGWCKRIINFICLRLATSITCW